jgi:hypothetical protein
MVASLQTLSLCQTVRMGPLGYKQCSELACAQLGASGIDTLAGLALYLRTHGNPFYLLEYCRLAIERELGSTAVITATAAATAADVTAATDAATAGTDAVTAGEVGVATAADSNTAAAVAASSNSSSTAAAAATDSAAAAAAATSTDERRDTVLSELGQQKQQQQQQHQQQQQPNDVSNSDGSVTSSSSAQGVWTLSTSKNVFRILQVCLTPSLTAMNASAAFLMMLVPSVLLALNPASACGLYHVIDTV